MAVTHDIIFIYLLVSSLHVHQRNSAKNKNNENCQQQQQANKRNSTKFQRKT